MRVCVGGRRACVFSDCMLFIKEHRISTCYYVKLLFGHFLSRLHVTSNSPCLLLGGPKVYDVSSYLDDHPGGAEVMLDVSGQDADEFFEDIGHSNDAREELAKHCIGVLKLDEAELDRRRLEAERKKAGGGGGSMGLIAVIGVVVAVGYFYYKNNLA